MTSFSIIAGSALMLAAILAVPGAAAPLLGTWAGDRLVLTIGATGATLESDCAGGSIAGALRPDASGRFQAKGHFETYKPGPQFVDESTPDGNNARFSGIVAGDVVALTITAPGAPPQSFTLKRDAATKLVRCY